MPDIKEEVEGIQVLQDAATFAMWNMEVRILFGAKDLLGMVDGTEVLAETADEKTKKLWTSKDYKAQHYILRTIDKKIKTRILTCKTAREMYDKLATQFNRGDEERSQNLLKDFYNFKFDKKQDMTANISELQNVFELNKISPEENKINDTMLITRIIASLPEKYNYFEAAWDSTEKKERTIDNLLARLVKEEEKDKKDKGEKKSEAAFKTTFNKKKGTFQGNCNKCGVKGHKFFECGKQFQQQQQGDKNTTNKFCHYCKRTNHWIKECQYVPVEGKPNCKYCKKNTHPSENCMYKEENEKNGSVNNAGKKAAFLVEKESMFANEDKEIDSEFVADSACTGHMTRENKMLNNVQQVNSVKIKVASGEHILANQQGVVESDSAILKDVLYVPELTRNLFSVSAATENGATVIFDEEKVQVCKNAKVMLVGGEIVMEGKKNDCGLYTINMEQKQEEAMLTEKNTEEIKQWHKKMGHLNYEDMKKLGDMCAGVPEILKKADSYFCDSCAMGKLVRNPFNSVRQRAVRPLQIIHTDVCGKIYPSTIHGENYFMTCLDDYTHFLKVYLLQSRSDVSSYLKEFIMESEAHFNVKASQIRSDQGGEYKNTDFQDWCKQRGIFIDFNVAHSSQLNGKAERMNLTLMNKVRAMLNDGNVQHNLWGYAVESAAYLVNRSPSKSLKNNVTPAEMWYNRKPDLSRVQCFGEEVYMKNLGYIKKLDNRGKPGIFVGYAANGYRILDPISKNVCVQRCDFHWPISYREE